MSIRQNRVEVHAGHRQVGPPALMNTVRLISIAVLAVTACSTPGDDSTSSERGSATAVDTRAAAALAERAPSATGGGVADADGRSPDTEPRASGAVALDAVNGDGRSAATEPQARDAGDDGSVVADPAAGVQRVKLSPMGRKLIRSAVADAPGYTPLDDPELDSVVRGKRNVGPVDLELTGGYPTAMALAERIIEAVNNQDDEALYALMITRKEFDEILWPEFPESRPATNVPAEEAWGFLWRDSAAGARRGAFDWRESHLTLDHLEYAVGLAPFTNFNLYRGVKIHARTGDGRPVTLDFVKTIVERNGVWKVYTYTD